MSNQSTKNNDMNDDGMLNAETQRKLPQGEILQPKLRFKGFTDPWQQRKYSDYLTESNIPGHDGSEANKLTVKLWGKGVVEKETVTAGSNATKYYIRHTGQLMYGKLDFLHAAFGLVPPELDGYESTADSPAFDILPSADPNFILMTCLSKHTYLYQGNLADGSRKAKRVHVPTFLDMSLNIPNIEEQYRIVLFLHTIDKLIAAAKKKADLLKLKKRYYLQAIFSQQLRFKGFTEPWQQRKLGDLLKFERPDRYIEPDGDYLSEGTTPVLTANKGFVLGYTNNSEGIYDKGACIIFDDFTLDRKLVRRPFKVRSSAIKILTANPSMDLYFIFELLEFQKFPSLGHARHYISVVEPWRAPVPDCSEQTHIGEMFRMMDDLIVAVTRKIELLERRKTAYLQRLFV